MLPSELEKRMSGRDLQEWAAFEKVFGPIVMHERIDAAQAMLSSTMARVSGAKGDLRPVKFLPEWDEAERGLGQTADEMVEVLRSMARKQKRKGGAPSPPSYPS